MIVLSGLVPGKDIEIIYTGLRPGEKLYEELFEDSERVESTAHPKINRAVGAPVPVEELDRWLDGLPVSLPICDEDELVLDLKRLVPSFRPGVSQGVS
jgi:FlaA1/EpsC-like NDP-sugar epimerase